MRDAAARAEFCFDLGDFGAVRFPRDRAGLDLAEARRMHVEKAVRGAPGCAAGVVEVVSETRREFAKSGEFCRASARRGLHSADAVP